jgi:maltooligosyltrehalose trehalohydrolase
MRNIDVLNRRIGVNVSGGTAEITLWAPPAQSVDIHFYPGDNKIPLQKNEAGYWTLEYKVPVDEKYKFILNSGKELPDPAALFQPDGVHGPSQIIDTGKYTWTDTGWQNILLEDYIMYELHTGTFTPEGTFSAITNKLDYLKNLGITAIELMPVAQFPGNRNWGYDGVFPYAVQNTYGGPLALQRLVNACHQKGMAIILDVVYNHLGPEGNYLQEFGPYFTDKYHTPWGKAINYDDEWCDEVRRYFIENALMWFRDFHFDALRFDAIHAVRDFSPKHIMKELKEYVDELMRQTGRVHYLIIECDLNDVRFINPVDKCGYGMDAQWCDEFHHSLRVSAGNEQNGYYSDFNGVASLAKSFKDAYVFDGYYSPHRLKTFGTKTTGNPGKQFIVFSHNHDQVGNRMLGERTSRLLSFEMLKLLAAAVLVSPYLPLLFMGEEWGETHPFQYFISHSDAQLVEAVRKGRKEEFAAFQAQGEVPDPQSEATFDRCKLQWELLEKGQHKVLHAYYKTLIMLRKENKVLKKLDRKHLSVLADRKAQTLTLRRWQEEEHLACLMNFSKEQQTAGLPLQKQWNKIFDSADTQWSGPAAAKATASGDETIVLQPESIIIYATTNV